MNFSLAIGMALAASIGIAPNAQHGPADEIKQLGTVLVTGKKPGPGMWRISNGNHVVWLLGTVSPLPKQLEWQSTEVARIMERTNAVLAPPGAEADISAGDVFKMTLLARSAIKATKLPGRKTLEDVLSAETYAQWKFLTEKYAFNSPKSERMRPVFAAQELYYSAIDHEGFTRTDVVWSTIRSAAAERSLPIIETKIKYPLAIDRKKYKAGIESLSSSTLGDIDCFNETMEEIEEIIEDFSKVSNSWVVGDIFELERLKISEINPPCKSYYDSVMGFQKREHLIGEQDSAWITAAESALSTYAVTIAVAPLNDMLKPGGFLERLSSKGYRVQGPDDAGEGADDAGEIDGDES